MRIIKSLSSIKGLRHFYIHTGHAVTSPPHQVENSTAYNLFQHSALIFTFASKRSLVLLGLALVLKRRSEGLGFLMRTSHSLVDTQDTLPHYIRFRFGPILGIWGGYGVLGILTSFHEEWRLGRDWHFMRGKRWSIAAIPAGNWLVFRSFYFGWRAVSSQHGRWTVPILHCKWEN